VIGRRDPAHHTGRVMIVMVVTVVRGAIDGYRGHGAGSGGVSGNAASKQEAGSGQNARRSLRRCCTHEHTTHRHCHSRVACQCTCRRLRRMARCGRLERFAKYPGSKVAMRCCAGKRNEGPCSRRSSLVLGRPQGPAFFGGRLPVRPAPAATQSTQFAVHQGRTERYAEQ
jgi:hypothetical protein